MGLITTCRNVTNGGRSSPCCCRSTAAAKISRSSFSVGGIGRMIPVCCRIDSNSSCSICRRRPRTNQSRYSSGVANPTLRISCSKSSSDTNASRISRSCSSARLCTSSSTTKTKVSRSAACTNISSTISVSRMSRRTCSIPAESVGRLELWSRSICICSSTRDMGMGTVPTMAAIRSTT